MSSDCSDYDEIEDCEHESILENGECEICGIILKGCFNIQQELSKTLTSIKKLSKKDLITNLDVPSDVKHEMREMNCRNDKKNIFICLYKVFIKLGYTFNPDKYAKQLGLAKKDINDCIGEISGSSLSLKNISEGFDIGVNIISPLVYFEDIYNECKLEDFHDVMKKELETLLRKNEFLFSFRPKVVCAAYIRFFLNSRGIMIKEVQKYISEASYKKIKREIDRT